jgi:hypothetical protein
VLVRDSVAWGWLVTKNTFGWMWWCFLKGRGREEERGERMRNVVIAAVCGQGWFDSPF